MWPAAAPPAEAMGPFLDAVLGLSLRLYCNPTGWQGLCPPPPPHTHTAEGQVLPVGLA